MNEELKKFALQRRNVNRRQAGFAIGFERGLKVLIMSSKKIAEVLIDGGP
jgi:aspartyl/asparaginyl-tRNA synthetase